MAVKMTPHGPVRPKKGSSHPIPILGKQIGDVIASVSPLVATVSGYYTIWATAAHTVRITDSAGNSATGGEEWASGEKQVRELNAGDKVHFV